MTTGNTAAQRIISEATKAALRKASGASYRYSSPASSWPTSIASTSALPSYRCRPNWVSRKPHMALGRASSLLAICSSRCSSNIILAKVGSRRWIARIMISWGIVSAAMMFVRSETVFYLLRFLLGVLEAGFVPGVVYCFMNWFPASLRGRINSLFFMSIAVCGLIGGPISGAIMKYMNAVGGLAGWQWLFLLEGIPSVLLGVLVLIVLDDHIDDAKWLTSDEKALLKARLAQDPKVSNTHSFAAALKEPSTYIFSIIYLGLAMGIYGIIFWMPQLVKKPQAPLTPSSSALSR